MNGPLGWLGVGAIVATIGAVLFAGSVNNQIESVHKRLDRHEKLIAALALLLPMPIPGEDRPTPQQEDRR